MEGTRIHGPVSAREAMHDPGRLEHLRSLVLAWARAWCRGAEDEADDLTQEVMVRVLSRLHQFRGEARLTSWTYAVARSVFVSHARRVSRRARSERRYATSATTLSRAAWAEPGDWLPPGSAVRWLRTWETDGILSEDERSTIELVVLGGLSATQVGRILGIAPGSVRARICRATRRIRERTMVRAAVLWAAVWVVSGCSPDGRTPLVATRDSAGVAIVESTGPSWTPETAWTVEPAPILDLGRTGTGPMHEFFRLADATFGADGGIVVADRGSAQVRFYDAQGKFTAALGTAGDGPGEFRQLNELARYAGDSVVAFDPRLRRGTVISAWGSLGRVVTFDAPNNTMPEEIYAPESGGFYVAAMVMPGGGLSPGRVRIAQVVLEHSATGVLMDTVAGMRGREQYVGPSGLTSPPFERWSYAAVHGGELYVCDGDRSEYRAFARDGALRRVIRLPNLSLDVPVYVLDSIRDVLTRGDEFSRGMAEVLLPTYPFCSGLLVDGLGYVWLERYHHRFRMSDEPRSWLVFSPDGEWLGQLDFPANFEVFEVDESRVLGMAKDSTEVQTVQVLRLRRRERRMGVRLRPKVLQIGRNCGGAESGA
jgi:RNA polymerase sigma factor (sigma-70 family)